MWLVLKEIDDLETEMDRLTTRVLQQKDFSYKRKFFTKHVHLQSSLSSLSHIWVGYVKYLICQIHIEILEHHVIQFRILLLLALATR